MVEACVVAETEEDDCGAAERGAVSFGLSGSPQVPPPLPEAAATGVTMTVDVPATTLRESRRMRVRLRNALTAIAL
jgi:hypothetical protein